MNQYISLILFILILAELIIYIVKYCSWVPFEKNKKLADSLLFLGIKLFSFEIKSKASENEIIDYVRENIRPYKIVNSTIYLRRRYLKWIQWATPAPIQARIKLISRSSDFTLWNVEIKSLFSPWALLIFSLLSKVFEDMSKLSVINIILVGVLGAIFLFIFALLEKKAIEQKIIKIMSRDNKYNYFA